MAIKLYGCSFVGNKVDFSFGEGIKVTCLDCGHGEIYKGAMHGDAKCPKCGAKNIIITSSTKQESDNG